MAIHNDDLVALERAHVIGGDGGKLGAVAGVYFDNETDRPDWIAVRSGLFGLNVALVPLAAAELRGEELHVPFDKDQLRSAPHHDLGRELSPQDEIDLFRHYGVSYGTWAGTVPSASEVNTRTAASVADADVDASAPTADSAMTRSEERLRVHTESQPVGRVRLRKHIVTEYQQITVPVRREEIRIEREPLGEADTVADAGATSAGAVGRPVAGRVDPDASVPTDTEGEQEIILYAERPVVRTETVAVERIRLGKQTVTDQETVGGEVRREEIELDDGPDGVRR